MEADRLLVSSAVLGVLAAASEERPVLCLVDDAQWLDKPSADALVFAARRFVAERIAILFGAREGDASAFEAGDLPDLLLSGLDHEAARNVLAARRRRPRPVCGSGCSRKQVETRSHCLSFRAVSAIGS